MERHIKAKANEKYQQIVAPGAMQFLDFARLQLKKGEKHSGKTGDREYALDVFSGTASISVEGGGGNQTFAKVGDRPDVFAGPPVVVYVPPQSSYEITAVSDSVDVGIFGAPAKTLNPPRLVPGAEAVKNEAGRDNWRRIVYSSLDTRQPADCLLIGETLNPSGNWSSYPPHKHDRSNPPNEAVLEEIYFFRVKPAQGFGFIYTYTAPDDPEGFSNVFVVRDGDTVLLPKGYHPVVAAPGYEVHYTWALAGEVRRYGAWSDDPQHTWVKQQ